MTGNFDSCLNLETGAEDLIGITDANKCLTEGDRSSCGWAAAAGLPFGLGKLKKLLRLERDAACGVEAAGKVAGPAGSVGAVLERAAASGGPTTRVVTNLTGTPTAGRPLSVAYGDTADALAAQARAQGTTYTAQIPNALLKEMERVGLVRYSVTSMGGVTGTEIRFAPNATEFVLPFFGSDDRGSNDEVVLLHIRRPRDRCGGGWPGDHRRHHR